MIGSLRGRLLSIEGMTALIEVGGVGYEVEMPISSLNCLKQDDEVFIYIHHIVREDASLLYGFADLASRSLFRELIKISGVGPKMGLAVLSTFDVPSFILTVTQGRATPLQQIPGVGKKTAERLIVELKDKLAKFATSESSGNTQVVNKITDSESLLRFDEAVGALIGLGYRENEALNYVKKVLDEKPEASIQEIIVASLALVNKGKA